MCKEGEVSGRKSEALRPVLHWVWQFFCNLLWPLPWKDGVPCVNDKKMWYRKGFQFVVFWWWRRPYRERLVWELFLKSSSFSSFVMRQGTHRKLVLPIWICNLNVCPTLPYQCCSRSTREFLQHSRAVTLASPSTVPWMQVRKRPLLVSVYTQNHTAQLTHSKYKDSTANLKSVAQNSCWKDLWPQAVNDVQDSPTSRTK
jgi:hypothetical protein